MLTKGACDGSSGFPRPAPCLASGVYAEPP